MPDPAAPREIQGAIALRDLSYRYPAAPGDALHGLNLEIHPGQTVAIMGRIGSGKTTLLNCMVRLLDPPAGTLLIDGVDVRGYPLARLREQVVLVPQDPFLFAELLRHNLSYDDPQRAEEAVWTAVEDVDLAGTVRKLERALDTLVGERGVTLSGGQKQRSALARGLIRDAPVLILDDCLSAVDTSTEEHILDRLFASRARPDHVARHQSGVDRAACRPDRDSRGRPDRPVRQPRRPGDRRRVVRAPRADPAARCPGRPNSAGGHVGG
jgi:ATP-binding cassette, subfamily B, multidrug efflux pump